METLQRTANRGSISTGPYQIDNSCKFEADNSESLERDPSSAGDRQKFTTSMWVKRTELGQESTIFGVQPSSSGSDTNTFQFGFMSDDKFQLGLQTYYVFNTNRLFRDTSAWYHIVMAVDTTQGTAANRIKLYINGIQETSFAVETYPNQNHSTGVNFTEPHRIGTLLTNSWYFSGYISEVNHVDGSQLTPTSFGEFDDDTGIWIPKKYTGSYGTNGFFLDFADASDLGDDESGNGNDFTENNITAADQATDTPTNNFATWNTLVTNAGVFTYTEGATKWKPSSGNWQTTTASMGFTKGKWYAEFKMDGDVTAGMVGLQELEKTTNYVGNYLGYSTNSTSMGLGYYNADGKIYKSAGSSSYGASYPSSVLVGVAIEYKDNGVLNLYVAKDNVWQNSADPANGTGGFAANSGSAVEGFFTFASSLYQNPGYWQANFGGYTVNSISSAATDANGYGTFEYAPPSGYYALCTKNLAEYG